MRDDHGQAGHITCELEVEYTGTWRDEIEAYINTVEADEPSDDGGSSDVGLCTDLLIELPRGGPLVEVVRVVDQQPPDLQYIRRVYYIVLETVIRS